MKPKLRNIKEEKFRWKQWNKKLFPWEDNKTDKFLAKFNRKNREKTQNTNIKNEQANFIMDSTNI